MERLHNKRLTKYSKKNRNDPTPQEKKLWDLYLQPLSAHFSRQKIIGKYIVDFYYAPKKLAIELDGSQHYERDGKEKDEVRDEFLRAHGITVKRYSNADINFRFESVCEDIREFLDN